MPNNKILVIDDDQLAINSIQRSLMFEDDNYEIIAANDGQAGVKIYHKENPILVLLDLNMPVMGGIDFLKAIELSPADPCAVIVLTGLNDANNIKPYFDLGVSAFLRKPFNIYEFLGLVKQAIALKTIQLKLGEQCKNHITAEQFTDEKNKILSTIMHKVKKPLIPIVNCTRDLLEGNITSEDDRIKKLTEIQNASKALVDVFENPYDISD